MWGVREVDALYHARQPGIDLDQVRPDGVTDPEIMAGDRVGADVLDRRSDLLQQPAAPRVHLRKRHWIEVEDPERPAVELNISWLLERSDVCHKLPTRFVEKCDSGRDDRVWR